MRVTCTMWTLLRLLKSSKYIRDVPKTKQLQQLVWYHKQMVKVQPSLTPRLE